MINPLRPTTAPTEGERIQLDAVAADPTRGKARRPWARDTLRRRLLALADATAVVVCTVGFGLTSGHDAGLVAYVLSTVVVLVVVAKLLGLYDRDHRFIRHLTLSELPDIVAFGAVATAEAVIALTFLGAQPQSGATLTQFAIALPALIFLARASARLVWRSITTPERVVIVGSGNSSRPRGASSSCSTRCTAI